MEHFDKALFFSIGSASCHATNFTDIVFSFWTFVVWYINVYSVEWETGKGPSSLSLGDGTEQASESEFAGLGLQLDWFSTHIL